MLLEIKNHRQYKNNYDSSLLRGIDDPETPRPWDIFHEIKQVSGKTKILLDMGCGTAFKIIPLAPFFQSIIGFDPSQSMLDAAYKNVKNEKANNVTLTKAAAEKLPFIDKSIDVITSMLSRWSSSEIHRVLKNNGEAIIEYIGCEDKKDFKIFFGKDNLGWRGQFIEYDMEEYINLCYEDFSRYFNYVSITKGYWNTYYTPEGINQLLLQTPTIRNFHPELDAGQAAKAIQYFTTEKGIKLVQNRILVHVKNPK